MPKQTFFNLNEQKRKLIEQAALDEFSEYGYDASNMNRIVSGASIAKGSFYQYFEDKKDLYFHLIDALTKKKIQLFNPFLQSYAQNAFAYNLNEIFRIGLAFADSDHKYYMLGEDFAKKQPEFMRELMEKYTPMSMDLFGKLLESAQSTGELHEGINIPLTASFISTLINHATVTLITHAAPKEQRNQVIAEMISFIERAVLKKKE